MNDNDREIAELNEYIRSLESVDKQEECVMDNFKDFMKHLDNETDAA
jgi:hypothetical protein